MFLVMALMGMRLIDLVSLAGPLLVILGLQVVAMAAYAVFVTFRVMGRDYDAAVLAAGHVGFALSSTAAALAIMKTITERRRTVAARLPHRADGGRLLHRHRQRAADSGLPGAAAASDSRNDRARSAACACAALGLALMASVGCARGAEPSAVQADLQTRLNRDVKPDLFRVVGLKREGSAPMPAGESGASRVIVYFNATLELAQDYSFGSWDELGSSSVAYALGATEKGLFGLQPENKAGDKCAPTAARSTNSRPTALDAGRRLPTRKPPPPRRRTSRARAPPSRSKQLIDRLAALVELPPPGRAGAGGRDHRRGALPRLGEHRTPRPAA